jgi:hypothetical protein
VVGVDLEVTDGLHLQVEPADHQSANFSPCV